MVDSRADLAARLITACLSVLSVRTTVTFEPYSITALWPVPKLYCLVIVNNLPTASTQQCLAKTWTCNLMVGSLLSHRVSHQLSCIATEVEYIQDSCDMVWCDVLQAPCCGKTYACRLCHNDSEMHEIDRHSVVDVVCALCSTQQPVVVNLLTIHYLLYT